MNKEPEHEHEFLMMKGNLPKEFLYSLGFVDAPVPTFSAEKVGKIQMDPNGPVSLRLWEKYAEHAPTFEQIKQDIELLNSRIKNDQGNRQAT